MPYKSHSRALVLFCRVLFSILSGLCVLSSCVVQAQEKNATGYYYPAGSSDTGGYLGWLGYNSPTYPWHLAQDMKAAYNGPVYAIDDGQVVLSRSDVGGYGGLDANGKLLPGGAFIVKHVTRSGRTFYMLYGHIKPDTLPAVGTCVTAGSIIAHVGHYWYPDGSDVSHVHSGCMPDTLPSNPWAGYCQDRFGDHLGFVNPWHDTTIDGHFYQGFLDNNQPSYNQGGGSSTNIYVDGNYSGSHNGTADNPYGTIGDAIAAAVKIASPTQAVTIHIKPFWYKENISIHNNILLVSNGTGTVRIGA